MVLEVRRMLHNIIDKAYEKDTDIDKYKKFYLSFLEKNYKSKGGDYALKKREIRIMGVGKKSAKDLCLTALHELAHHIDNMQRDTTDHSAKFYSIYQKLVHSALDIGFMDIEDVRWVIENSSYADSRKVARFLDEYAPHYNRTAMINGNVKICVYNSFNIRSVLKEKGYRYNGVDKSWCKTIEESAVDGEKEFLLLHIQEQDIDIVDTNKVHIRNRMYIEVKGNTFQCKDILKNNGFSASKSGKKWSWKKETSQECSRSEYQNISSELADFEDVKVNIV